MHTFANRPRTLHDLQPRGAVFEDFLPLREAQVAIADYQRLFIDFPWLIQGRSQEDARQAADTWLLSNAAVISRSQAQQMAVNSTIRVASNRVLHGCRFPRQGRSAFVSAPRDGESGSVLLNVKGVGVSELTKPARAPQRNGLIPLYCAIYEFLMHRLVAAAFKHAGAPHRVLPAYAVIDTGFDELELNADIGRPAGILVRAAHYRPISGDLPRAGSVLQLAVTEAEFVLRQYGLTSSNTSPWLTIQSNAGALELHRWGRLDASYPPDRLAHLHSQLGGGERLEFDGINLQYTDHFDWSSRGLELIDLHYEVRPVFDLPVVTTVCDRELGWGGHIWTDHPNFIQPKPELLCDPTLWPKRRPTAAEVKVLTLANEMPMDGGILSCLDAALRLRKEGSLDPAILYSMVQRTVDRWPNRTVNSDQTGSISGNSRRQVL